MDVEVSAKETTLEDKVDGALNTESNDSNVENGEPSSANENEDSRNSDEQETEKNEVSEQPLENVEVEMNELPESSVNGNSQEGDSENTREVDNVENEEIREEVQGEDKSQSETAEEVQNGASEDVVNDAEKDSDRRMEIDENEEDDDDDFNPLLLCPDISMDVDESPVLTGATEPSRCNDAADSNSLFAPLFSTFVDEMTGAEISFNLTADEQQLREKLYGPNNPIQFTKIHCTACNVHLGSAPAGQTNRFVHPLLKVLICKECYHFYTSGEFEKDEDGSELYCRWCGQGGQVLCCTMCEFVFCKKCIRINFGRKKLTQVRDSEEWKCFRCDMSQLKALRAMCVEFFEYIRKETARASTYGDSEAVNKDLTNCCQVNKKRQAEPEKETEKEVVKRPKRRKNEEEDPDYNPYAQNNSDERSNSPVPSTSGIKPMANSVKVTYSAKPAANRNEVTQIPSNTVRIGNQLINVKNVSTTSPAAVPNVRNTAIRSPIVPPNIRIKPVLTARGAAQAANVRPVNVVPAVGSVPQIRAVSKSQSSVPIMKHEWFEKTVRAAARVNSNLSYTLTQLNKAQSSASSVEQLAVVHNKLQEILSSSINSLIQIRKNLRTEFIAGIKTIRFPPKPTVDPNDDDVIIVNPEPKATTNNTRNTKGNLPVPALVSMNKSNTQVSSSRANSNNSVSNNIPNKGYLKVRSFQQLQTVSSECITIPDDDPPPSNNTEPVVVDGNEESVAKDSTDDVSKENEEDKEEDVMVVENIENKESESEEINKVESENPEISEASKESKKVTFADDSEKDVEETNDNQSSNTQEEKDKESESNVNEDCVENGENTNQTERRKSNDEVESTTSETNVDEPKSDDSQNCNGNGEVTVKTEPNEDSYNVKDRPSPKIRRMLSVKVNLKKTPIVEDMVKQEPLENGDNQEE